MKRLNKKGFTMAELLIVVAIIAVLVAIAIPVFTTQLEKSRDSVSVANIRAAYAEASTAYLTWNGTDATVDGMAIAKSGTNVTVTVTNVSIKSQKSDNWSGLGSELPLSAVPADDALNKDDATAVFTYDTTAGTWSVALN